MPPTETDYLQRSYLLKCELKIAMRSRTMPYVSSNTLSQFSFGIASPRGSSVFSEPRTHWSVRTSSQAADAPVELMARFPHSPHVTLARTNYGNRSSKITPHVVATSVSGSGETLAIVEENEYRVYKTGARGPIIKPKCVGIFEENGSTDRALTVLKPGFMATLCKTERR